MGQALDIELEAGKAYGQDFASRFWLDSQKSHVSRTMTADVLAVTQIRSPFATPQPSASIPYDDAYLITLMVEDVLDHELWQDGRAVRTPPFKGGSTVLFDLRRDPVSFTRTAHHSLHFYIPRTTLCELAERNGEPLDGELRFDFATAYDDPVVRHIGHAALALLDHDGSRLALDCLMQSLAAHALHRYGQGSIVARSTRKGLPPRSVRIAQEAMEASLGCEITVKELADLCGISPSHFSRSFKQATGFSPHGWLQARRVQLAKDLMRQNSGTLADVACRCGFADQSHFTRVFSRAVGETPMRWLRGLSD